MSLGDDLVDAIVARPDDPAARLVYADHRLASSPSDTHAELIVVQERLAELEATRLWRDLFSDEAERLRRRERTLVRTLEDALDIPSLLAQWRRGFVETLTLGAASPRNLVKRIRHPALRVVRALRFADATTDLAPIAEDVARTVHRLEGDFTSEHALALDAIDEVRVPIANARLVLPSLRRLERLELTETAYEPAPADVRDVAWGYVSARRRIEHGASAHAVAEQKLLAALVPQLPPVRHLSLETTGPLAPGVFSALAAYPGRGELASLRLPCGGDNDERRLTGLGSGYRAVVFEAQPNDDREIAARSAAAIGSAYMAFGRPREAADQFDDAYTIGEGRSPQWAALHSEAAKAAGLTRKLTDPDPARDGLVHRVPALLHWGQLDRVLAVAPNHAGAWALQGLRLRDDEFDLDGATAAFARALEGEKDAGALASAYALMNEDAPAALAVLNDVRPSVHANVLFASIHALQSKPEIALGLLCDEGAPVARLACGLFERQHGRAAAGREIWRALATERRDAWSEPARWVIAFFAAVLASAEPYPLRRAFHEWLASAGPARPQPLLVFDPLIRLASKVMPQVDLTMVRREVDRLRGA